MAIPSQNPGTSNPNEDHARNGNCGPTSVTMVARAFGKVDITAAQADAAIERSRAMIGESQNEARGTSVAGLAKALRGYGLDAKSMGGASAEAVRRELEKGRLVIVHVVPKYLRESATGGHYAVVTKIEGGKAYLNDPATTRGPIVIAVADLDRAIRARGTYMMVSAGP